MKKITLVLSISLALFSCKEDKKHVRDSETTEKKEIVSASGDTIPFFKNKEAFFGETHVHTSYSLDAYLGGTRLKPTDAYRFAKGETVDVNGNKITISKPLDFCAVTDHAEYIGEMYANYTEASEGHDHPKLIELRSLTSFKEQEKWFFKYVVNNNRSSTPQRTDFFPGEEAVKNGWQVMIDAVNEHYTPGTFTTIAGFEWTAAPNGGNLHRNILFRDMNLPDLPVGTVDINREEALWKWMAGLEEQGMHVFAIPHNSNASKGMMFNPNDSDGNPIDEEYVKTRNYYEPLIEMMQIKGNSEVHAKFWTNDEFADFENANSMQNYSGRKAMKENFVRYGLIKGLDYENKLGTNPYKYGIVGGTDSHNGTPSNVTESNFEYGSHGAADGSIEIRRTSEVGGWIKGKDLNPGALTGVWASQNTREDIWDAMRNKETFATSGTRLKVRFFGGFDLDETLNDYDALVADGYNSGIPMGQTLKNTQGKAPEFSVFAMKDPDGANLDRIQIIKGWIENSETKEEIYNVAWSDERKLDANGKLPEVGNTVDLTTATYTNSIGSTQLMGFWKDPSFNPEINAIYYVRVIEIPTPRWSTYDAVRANLPLLDNVAATVQERGWTSPIWYTPK
ncbi:DUF3604 domain-containing protein [Tamlana sp. 2_MG-2023]|uniref:DUF3604 domain-containing protein n=1 Tax=unclassified Tamlana TaxID=2614803 RepID=UPI0026E2AE53|nr:MULTISPECIES: DUF3604 domain-containing protein [unclassified Tamlana]MDO6761300.1 DUF3604 domain-containing protein [Tamlana sp. 2_MG-2023]MDO6791783.1 DUF3604 domain-containing protein [Tamlana sp. 1_MG-2023]